MAAEEAFSSSDLLSVIFLVGHFVAQMPQLMHFAGSITARAPLISIACTGQLFTQRVHPMHPTEQTFLTSGPLRGELQETLTFDFLGTSTNTSLGQFSTQAPHPTHFSASTTARPFFIVMAWKAQTLTHVPRPMHPYAHEVGPFPGTTAAALQSYSPK